MTDQESTFSQLVLPSGRTLKTPEEVLAASSELAQLAQIGLSPESGRLPPPAQAAEAAAQTPLNSPQQAMAIGEPVPVVFARRRNGVGGVLVFPKATEAAFSNTSTQQTARYHCVLGVGPMGSIQTRDFRVGACRVGTFSQNYDKRAGTWSPGNTATPQAGYTVPTFPTACGGGGAYYGLSTLEFSNTTTGGTDDWRTGCNVFVREGLQVTRLLDSVSGPSDNFADLLLWALQRSGRVPAAMIDTASFTAAARFLDVNGLLCNGEFSESSNLADFMLRLLPYFLLRETRIGGKFALRPLLPTNFDGTIDTTTLAPDWVLTESVILPGTFSQEWSDAGTRLAPRLAMLWRQQDDTNMPIVRTLHVGLDRPGPAEQHDLSRFCASEIHAARVGAYLHGRRYLSTHTAALTLLPGSHTGRIQQGDVVFVGLPLVTGREPDDVIADWYSVESVSPSADGSEALTLSHFPVDSLARSLLALEVANITAPGSLLPYPPIGACDLPGRSASQAVPASTTSGTPFANWGSGITVGENTDNQGTGSVTVSGGGGGGGTYDTTQVPDDGPKEQESPTDEPPVNPAEPGGPLPPPGEPLNPSPDGYDECPNGTQTVSITVRGGYYDTGGQSNLQTTPISTRWGAISTVASKSVQSFGTGYVNAVTYVDSATGDTINTTFTSTDQHPLSLEATGYRCDVDGNGTPGPPVTSRRVTVQKGDTLYDIAGKLLGNPNRWPEIYALNTGNIKNPDLIYPGQVLKVPTS